MPDDIEAQRDTFRQMGKTAFVVGYTGEVGKELVKELLKSKIFSRLTLIGRRIVNYEDELYKDVVSTSVCVCVCVCEYHCQKKLVHGLIVMCKGCF